MKKIYFRYTSPFRFHFSRHGCLITNEGYKYKYFQIGFITIFFLIGFDSETYIESIMKSGCGRSKIKE